MGTYSDCKTAKLFFSTFCSHNSKCRPQNVESYSHNSKCDGKMLKVTVIIRNVTQNVESCSHNSKCDGKMLKVAVIIRNVTAKC